LKINSLLSFIFDNNCLFLSNYSMKMEKDLIWIFHSFQKLTEQRLIEFTVEKILIKT